MVLVVTGCAGTKTLIDEKYNGSHEDVFEINIVNTAGATEAGLNIFESELATYNDELKVGSDNPNRVVNIEFTHYYVRHGATRALVGVMAGSDNVTTVTTIRDAGTDNVLGSVRHVT